VIIERLDPSIHDRDGFDCGEPSLNQFLKTYANQFRERGLGVTWVGIEEAAPHRIIGYYTLSMSSVMHKELENRRIRLSRIPVVLLGRLAIDQQTQGRGLGTQLLIHALYAALQLSTQIGAHAVVVDPLDARAAAFYQHFDFQPMSGAPERLYLEIKHITKTLGPSSAVVSAAPHAIRPDPM
jgi:GNAT superfamily N-acetyltransferase